MGCAKIPIRFWTYTCLKHQKPHENHLVFIISHSIHQIKYWGWIHSLKDLKQTIRQPDQTILHVQQYVNPVTYRSMISFFCCSRLVCCPSWSYIRTHILELSWWESQPSRWEDFRAHERICLADKWVWPADESVCPGDERVCPADLRVFPADLRVWPFYERVWQLVS